MAFKLFSDVRETSTTGGTGDQILAGALDGSYFPFSARYSAGDTFFYCAKQGSLREVGLGTYVSGNKLSRTKVYKSTNANNLVNFAAATVDIFVTNIAPDDLDAAGKSLLLGALGATANVMSQNWIINGDFSVSVRGNSKTPGVGVYGYDRWKGHASGLVQRVYGLPAGIYTLAWGGGGNATFNGTTAASPIVSTWGGGNADIVVPATATSVCLVPGDRSGESGLFKARPYIVEAALCRMFYQRVGAGWRGRAWSGSDITFHGSFGAMFTAPSGAVIAGSGSNAAGRIGAGTDSVLSVGSIGVLGTADSLGCYFNGTGTFASGGEYFLINNMIALDADA